MIIACSTPVTSPTDIPRIDLLVTEVPDGTVVLNVERRVGGRWWRVRTPGNPVSGATAYIEDAEVPVGAQVPYQAAALSVDGSVLATATATAAALPDPPSGRVWLSDPLDAASAVLVQCTSETDPQRPFEMDIDDAYPLGARFGSAAYGVQRHGALRFEVYCPNRSIHSAVAELLSGGVLVRAEAWRDLPPLIYGPPRDYAQRVTPRGGDFWSLHEFSIIPTVGPGVSVVLPRRTWADLMAEAATWADVVAMYPTWVDVIRGGAV